MSTISLRFVCCEPPAQCESNLPSVVLDTVLTSKLQVSLLDDMTVADLFDYVECVIRDVTVGLNDNGRRDSESVSPLPFCLSVQWEGSVFPVIPLPHLPHEDMRRPLLTCVPSRLLLLGRGSSSSCTLTIVVSWTSTSPMDDDDISSSGDALCFVLPFGKCVNVAHTTPSTSFRDVVIRYLLKNAADSIKFVKVSCANVVIDLDTTMTSILDTTKNGTTITIDLVCKKQHALSTLFGKPSYYDGGVACDRCWSPIEPSTGFLHCKTCKYDLCRNCMNVLLP